MLIQVRSSRGQSTGRESRFGSTRPTWHSKLASENECARVRWRRHAAPATVQIRSAPTRFADE
eukprot:14889972-Alexandrium_andersonii.AAC.1